MRTAALVRGFSADHFRTNAVLVEAIAVALFLAIFLEPKGMPYRWPYLAMSLCIMAMFMAALVTSLLAWRNSVQKIDQPVLKAGRLRCYCGILLAALAITIFWVLIIAAYIYVFLLQRSLPEGIATLAAAVLGLVLVVAALFLLFSSLVGRAYEPPLAVILVIIGLSSSYFINLGPPWSNAVILFPPLLENVQALSGAGAALPLARTLVYFAVLLAAGLLRFSRREFTSY